VKRSTITIITVVLGILIGLYLFFVPYWKSRPSVVAVQGSSVAAQALDPTSIRWQAYWKKHPSAKGTNPNKQDAVLRATITKHDIYEFKFVAYGESGKSYLFHWNKAENSNYGLWSCQQDGNVKGHWRLDQDLPTLFTGWIRDEKVEVHFRLVAID